jgi:hypothetical protein
MIAARNASSAHHVSKLKLKLSARHIIMQSPHSSSSNSASKLIGNSIADRRQLDSSICASMSWQVHQGFSCLAPSLINRRYSASATGRNNSFFQLLSYKELKYDSVEIDVEKLMIDDSSEFGVRLWTTLSELKTKRKSCIYVKIPIRFAHYISIAG